MCVCVAVCAIILLLLTVCHTLQTVALRAIPLPKWTTTFSLQTRVLQHGQLTQCHHGHRRNGEALEEVSPLPQLHSEKYTHTITLAPRHVGGWVGVAGSVTWSGQLISCAGHLCMHIRTHMRTYVHTYTHMYMHTHIHTHTHTYTRVHVCISMYVCLCHPWLPGCAQVGPQGRRLHLD